MRKNLTLELGLRYDWNMSPTERFDRFINFVPATDSLVEENHGIAPVYKTNNKNWQPRVGFAWDPWGDGKTSIRAAYAVLVDQPITNLVTGLASNPPFATPVALPSRLPTGVTANFANLNVLAAPGTSLSPNATDLGFDNAYVQSWNVNFQREVLRGIGVTIGYFGSKGTHLRLSRNINQILPNGLRPFIAVSASSPISPNVPLLNITEREGTGNSSYNALWATAQKRLGHGLQFNASYTFSKSIDYNSQSSQGVTLQDSYNIRGDRGLSDFDARHRFVVSGLYEFPFRGNRLKEGWEMTVINQAQSGNPINILAGNAGAITGGAQAANANSLTGLATLRPDVRGPVQIIGSPNQWFNNLVCDPRPGGSCPAGAVFVLPVSVAGTTTVYHFGDLGRNVVIGPTFNNTDFSIIKNTNLTEKVRMQFRAEFFDIFNHANFGQPGRTAQVGSTSFGVITNTRFPTGDSGSSRQIQFAMKLLF